MNLIKKLLREGLNESVVQFYPFYEDVDLEGEFDLEMDEMEAENQAVEVAKNGGVTILRDKSLSAILVDTQYMRVVGGLWTSNDSNTYSFDLAIDSGYQGMGLSNQLLDAALSEYSEQREVYGDDLEIEVDVINPKLAQILQKKYGFHVIAQMSQDRVLMSLNEAIEKYDGYEFVEDHYDHNNNQDYIRCTLEKDGQVLAKADYVQYEGKIYMNYIDAMVKGKGYGSMLMKHIAKLYGYENMPATSLTPDGAKMRQKLDKHFNYTPKEINNHIPVSELDKIKNPVIKTFLLDLTKMGYTKVWEKWLAIPEFKPTNEKLMQDYDIDFNEISDIGEWIQGSETNSNDPEDEPPHFITDYLNLIS